MYIKPSNHSLENATASSLPTVSLVYDAGFTPSTPPLPASMWWRGTVVASPRRPSWSSCWCSRSCRLEGAPQERKPRRLRRQSNFMIILGWFPAGGYRKKLDGLFHGKSQSKIDDFNGGSPISGNFHIWIYLWRFPTIGVPAYASSILDWNLHNFPGKKRHIQR